MSKIWDYEDYINHLSHQNITVRRWAFRAIESQYPNRYTDQACNLIGDDEEHLACAAPRYLGMHGAVQHAEAILEAFKNGQGNVPSNCAIALGNMIYEPAVDVMLEYFSRTKSSETFLGILAYLGKIHREDCRDALISAVAQMQDKIILDSAVADLLHHHNPEDVPFVLDRYFDIDDRDQHSDTDLRSVSSALGGAEYFRDLTGGPQNDLLEKPAEVIDKFVLRNSAIKLDNALYDNMTTTLGNGLYEDFATMIMFEAAVF